MRIELDLTRAEMMAFGFAVGAGMLRLDVTEDPEALERALFSLHEKVVRATQRAAGVLDAVELPPGTTDQA